MKIAIVGGGISGLAIGYILSKSGYNVTIFEQHPEPGGIAESFKVKDNYLDKYYRHLFLGHDEIIQVIKDLGLSDQLVWTSTKMAFLTSGTLYPFNSALDLIRFKPLSIFNRFRVGLNTLLFLLVRDWSKLDKLSAADVLRKYSGRSAYRVIWEPLLKNKFGSYCTEISATWLWDRVTSRGKSKKKNNSGELLGYLEGSFGLLLEKLKNAIESNGGRIATKFPVSKILIQNKVCRGVEYGDKQYSFDKTIVTLPVPQFLKIAPDLPTTYSRLLEDIKYSNSICVVLRLKEKLSDYYWINIGDPKIPFAVIIEHTNMIPPHNYGNEHIVYLSQYMSQNEWETADLSDEVILHEYTKHLKQLFPFFKESNVINYHIFKDQYTQPIFTRNFLTLKPDHSTPINNLLVANTSQFYPESRCMNTSFKMATKILKILKDSLPKDYL